MAARGISLQRLRYCYDVIKIDLNRRKKLNKYQDFVKVNFLEDMRRYFEVFDQPSMFDSFADVERMYLQAFASFGDRFYLPIMHLVEKEWPKDNGANCHYWLSKFNDLLKEHEYDTAFHRDFNRKFRVLYGRSEEKHKELFTF